MADQFEKLVVQLSGDLRGYQNAMRQAVGVTNARAREIENRYKRMNASISRTFTAPLAAAGAALSTREIMRYADAWTNAGNMIASSAQAAGVQTRALEELRRGADEARTSLETYVDLYARMIRSASNVAKSEEEIALATSLVAKAMKAGGAAVSEQQAAIVQLGQALGSGVLQGDELRSLRENAPIIAQAIAEEFGTTIAGLKKLGEDGKLTSERVFRAIVNAQSGIEAQFAKTNRTISDGFVLLGNAVTEWVGKAAQASGVTAAINAVLAAAAGNIDAIAAAAAAAGVVLLTRYVPAVTRATAATALMVATNPFLALAAAIGTASFALAAFGDDLHPIQGEMATLRDYAVTAWDEIQNGATEAARVVSDAFLTAINLITEAVQGVSVTWADVTDTVKGLINAKIGAVVVLAKVIEANFTVLPSVIGAAAVSAMNAMVSAIEAGINRVVGEINRVNSAVNAVSGAVGFGDIVPSLPSVSLGRIENTYLDDAKAAGTVLADGIAGAMDRDYIGDAVGAASDKANITAFRRKIEAALRESDGAIPMTGFGGGIPMTGFGGGTPTTGDEGARNGRSRSKDELQREIEQIRERTAALVAESEAQARLNPLVDDFGYAAEKAAATQDLLVAAQRAGVTVTPELRAEIEALADAYATASAASAQLDEAQDQAARRAEDIARLRQEAIGGFARDLLEGKDAAEALASALGRVGERLIDLAIGGLFESALGGVRKGGLLGGAIIPGILHGGGTAGVDGYGHGRSFPASTWFGAKRYHTGGMVSDLRAGEVPAILQTGETVIPRGGSGGTVQVQLSLTDDIDARIVQVSGPVAVQVVKRTGPGVMADAQRRSG